MSPKILQGVFGRLQTLGIAQAATEQEERREVREYEEKNRLLEDACHRALADAETQLLSRCFAGLGRRIWDSGALGRRR
jgi:hypothetical protein